MINISNSIKKDLGTNINNFDYLVSISGENKTFNLSSAKQYFQARGTSVMMDPTFIGNPTYWTIGEETLYGVQDGQNGMTLGDDSFHYTEELSGSNEVEPEQLYKLKVVVADTPLYTMDVISTEPVFLIEDDPDTPEDESVQMEDDPTTHEDESVTTHVSSLYNEGVCYLRIGGTNYGPLKDGDNEFFVRAGILDQKVGFYNPFYDGVWGEVDDDLDEYPTMIGTHIERLYLYPVEEEYYEDILLSVGGFKENLDINTKKVKMSGSTISISNAEIDGERFLDRAGPTLNNANIDIYIKTQSCLQLSECMKISSLRVKSVKHDNMKVSLDCEDRFIDEIHTELPNIQYSLYEGKQTFSQYNEDRIPILYGHLKEAPAVIYINDWDVENDEGAYKGNNIFIVPDRAFLDSSYNIKGIKDIVEPQHMFSGVWQGADEDLIKVTDMIDQDVLTVECGNAGARVLKYVPNKANEKLVAGSSTYGYKGAANFAKQFIVADSGNYLRLYTADDIGVSSLIGDGHLLVGETSKLIEAKTHIVCFNIANSYNDGNQPWYHFHDCVSTAISEDHLDRLSINGLFINDVTGNGVFYRPGPVGTNKEHFIPVSSVGFANPFVVRAGEAYTSNITENSGYTYYDGYDFPSMSLTFEKMKASPKQASFHDGRRSYQDGHIVGGIKLWKHQHSSSWNYIDALDFYFYPEKATFEPLTLPDDYIFQSLEERVLGHTPTVANGGNAGDDGLGSIASIRANQSDPSKPCSVMNNMSPFTVRFPKMATMGIDSVQIKHSFNSVNQQGEYVNQWKQNKDWVQGYNSFQTSDYTMSFLPNIQGGESNGNRQFYGHHKMALSGLLYKRTWWQENAIQSKFFLNAKGKYKYYNLDYEDVGFKVYQTKKTVIKHHSPNPTSGGANSGWGTEDEFQVDDKPFLQVIDYLTNDRLRYVTHDKKQYEIMIYCDLKKSLDHGEPPQSAWNTATIKELGAIYFDIDVHNIWTPSENKYMWLSHKIFRTNMSSTTLFVEGDQAQDNYAIWSEHFQLIYGRKEYSDDGFTIEGIDILNEEVFVEDVEDVDGSDTANVTYSSSITVGKWEDGWSNQAYSDVDQVGWIGMYTALDDWDSNIEKLIRQPSHIMEDLVQRELGLSTLHQKNVYDSDYLLDFSINKTASGTEVLENICKNTNFFFRTRISDGQPSVFGIPSSSNINDVLDKSINVNSIIKYSFDKTPMKDVKIGVVVKYSYDYISEKMTKETPFLPVMYHNRAYYEEYYNINYDDRDKYTLEHEAPYIQDQYTASKLAIFLLNWYQNQHLIINFDISLGEVLELEVGDIINFVDNNGDTSDIGGVKPYGRSITETYDIFDGSAASQEIYPWFMITEIKKDIKKSSIKCVQLHDQIEQVVWYNSLMPSSVEIAGEDLTWDEVGDWTDLPMGLPGDVNLDGNQGVLDAVAIVSYYNDPEGHQAGSNAIQPQGMRNMDINNDGFITLDDLELLGDIIGVDIVGLLDD